MKMKIRPVLDAVFFGSLTMFLAAYSICVPAGARPQLLSDQKQKMTDTLLAPIAADDLPGIRMQIRELKHTANSVTLRLTLFNDGSAPFAIGYNFGGWGNVNNIRLIDAAANKSYSVTFANG